MLNIGSRSSPTALTLVLIVIVIITVASYMLFPSEKEELSWFSNRFAETPSSVIVHCHGKSIYLDRASNHFSALADIVNEILSRQKRYDSLLAGW